MKQEKRFHTDVWGVQLNFKQAIQQVQKDNYSKSVFCDQEVIGIFVFFTNRACEEDPSLVQRAIAAATPFKHQELYVA